MRVGRLRGVGRHEDGVAVRLGARHVLRGNTAKRTGAVVHDHRLARGLGHFGGNTAGQPVGGAAGCGADHDGDGFGRKGLGQRTCTEQRGGGGERSDGRQCQQGTAKLHVCLPGYGCVKNQRKKGVSAAGSSPPSRRSAPGVAARSAARRTAGVWHHRGCPSAAVLS